MTTPRRVDARAFSAQRLEALGETPQIDFTCADGRVVTMRHPGRLDEEALARYEALRRGDGLDTEPLLDPETGIQRRDPNTGRLMTVPCEPATIDGKPAPPYAVRLMKAVLGESNYAVLIGEGLAPVELATVWQEMAEPVRASDADPKDSSPPT